MQFFSCPVSSVPAINHRCTSVLKVHYRQSPMKKPLSRTPSLPLPWPSLTKSICSRVRKTRTALFVGLRSDECAMTIPLTESVNEERQKSIFHPGVWEIRLIQLRWNCTCTVESCPLSLTLCGLWRLTHIRVSALGPGSIRPPTSALQALGKQSPFHFWVGGLTHCGWMSCVWMIVPSFPSELWSRVFGTGSGCMPAALWLPSGLRRGIEFLGICKWERGPEMHQDLMRWNKTASHGSIGILRQVSGFLNRTSGLLSWKGRCWSEEGCLRRALFCWKSPSAKTRALYTPY